MPREEVVDCIQCGEEILESASYSCDECGQEPYCYICMEEHHRECVTEE